MKLKHLLLLGAAWAAIVLACYYLSLRFGGVKVPAIEGARKVHAAK